MIRTILFSLLVSMMILSCQEAEFDNVDKFELDKRYFPNKVGQYRIYRVDSVQYDFDTETLTSVADTASYFIKEQVIDTIKTQDGLVWTEIEVSRRNVDRFNFTTIDYYRERVEDLRALRYENGLSFVKMTFPITRGKKWDGNIFFDTPHAIRVKGDLIEDYKNFSYKYKSTMDSVEVNNTLLDSVVFISQKEEPENSVTLFKDVSEEYYAKDLGLVKKYRALLQSSCASSGEVTEFCINNPIEYHADRGYVLTMELVEYGGLPRNR